MRTQGGGGGGRGAGGGGGGGGAGPTTGGPGEATMDIELGVVLVSTPDQRIEGRSGGS